MISVLQSHFGMIWLAAVFAALVWLVVSRLWDEFREHRAWARVIQAKAVQQRPVSLSVVRPKPVEASHDKPGRRRQRWRARLHVVLPRFRWRGLPGWCRLGRIPVFRHRVFRNGRTVVARLFWYPGLGFATRVTWHREDGLLQDAGWFTGGLWKTRSAWGWQSRLVPRRPNEKTIPMCFLGRAVVRQPNGTLVVGTAYQTQEGPVTRVVEFRDTEMTTVDRYWLCGDVKDERVEACLSARLRLTHQAA